MIRVICYSVGYTHQLYFNLSDEDAEQRWNEQRADRNQFEVAYEKKMGYEVKRTVSEIEDELMIWGDAGKEMNAMINMMLSGEPL